MSPDAAALVALVILISICVLASLPDWRRRQAQRRSDQIDQDEHLRYARALAVQQQRVRRIERDRRLLNSGDGLLWAAEFVSEFEGETVGNSATVDEGLMLAWFANAIETGKRLGRESERSELVTQ